MAILLLCILALVVVMISGTPVSLHDACTLLHIESFCQEHGFCFSLDRDVRNNTITFTNDPEDQISCAEAYIVFSDNLLTDSAEPPILISLTRAERIQASAVYMDVVSDAIMWPLVDPPDQILLELAGLVSQVYVKFENEFPYILAEPDFFTDMITLAERLEETVLIPNRNSWEIVYAYRRVFASLSTVRGINKFIELSVEYVSSSSPGALRHALFSHLVVFVHAWCRVSSALRVPPYISLVEILEQATQFEPAYVRNTQQRGWRILISRDISGNRDDFMPMLPVQPLKYDEENFPLVVLDAMHQLGRMGASFSVENVIEETISVMTRIESILTIRPYQNLIPHLVTIRYVLFFFRHHPMITNLNRAEFCLITRQSWISLFRRLTSAIYGPLCALPQLGAVFHICEESFIPLDVRVKYALPVLVGVQKATASIIRVALPGPQETLTQWFRAAVQVILNIPLDTLRNAIVFDSATTHEEFVQTFVRAALNDAFDYSTGSPIPLNDKNQELKALGIVVALLVIEGDISQIIVNTNAESLFFSSESVRAGFCRVLNCVVFESLFDTFQIHSLLDLLKTYTPLRNARLARYI